MPPTTERVTRQTSGESTTRIAGATAERVDAAASADRPWLDRRLEALDREWDIERVLEANAAAVSLIGLALGRFVDRRFYLLPTAVAGFLLQHALQGWCPPLPLFRRLGIRTAKEIAEESLSLKFIRGDFAGVTNESQPREILRAVQR